EAISFYKSAKVSNPSSDEVDKKIGKTALRIAEERGEFELKTVPIQKFPEVSGLLSLLFAGLGQFYNGDIGKGIAGVLLSTLFLAVPFIFKQPWFILLWVFLNFGFALEAYHTAKRMTKKGNGS
ncbi:hypothetical protein H5T87_11485, partial [bacterium]|nr:hypothetical protein [bacterium]